MILNKRCMLKQRAPLTFCVVTNPINENFITETLNLELLIDFDQISVVKLHLFVYNNKSGKLGLYAVY